MASVQFDSTLGGDGSTVSDDDDDSTGLKNYGWVTRFIPALQQFVAMLGFAKTQAQAAAASAAAAQAATTCTSTDTETLSSSALVTFTTQAGLNIVPGMYMRAASNANAATHWMSGFVTSYAGTSLQIQMDTKGSGTGSRADWSISSTATTAGAVQTSRQISAGGIATGGGDLSADRTITVSKATGAEICFATEDGKAVTPKAIADATSISTETDGATITPTFTDTMTRRVTLGGNRTVAAPAGVKLGFTYNLLIVQDGTGGRTLAWNSVYKFGQAGAPSLSTAAAKEDMVTMTCVQVTPSIIMKCTFWKDA